MFLGMQDFDFAQTQSNLPKFNYLFAQISLQFYPNFASILPKSNHICPNLINFAQKNFARGCGFIPASPAPTALVIIHVLKFNTQTLKHPISVLSKGTISKLTGLIFKPSEYRHITFIVVKKA